MESWSLFSLPLDLDSLLLALTTGKWHYVTSRSQKAMHPFFFYNTLESLAPLRICHDGEARVDSLVDSETEFLAQVQHNYQLCK